jgi:hypothetical protein
VEKSVKKDLLRGERWPVYKAYDISLENGEFFVKAPVDSLLERVGERTSEDGGHTIEYRLRDPAADIAFPYAPLRTPELLVDLADLADEPITPEVVRSWAEVYGLLACSPEEDVVDAEGILVKGWGRRDSVARFSEAARELGACLRMYEAVKHEGPVDLEELSASLGPLPPAFEVVLETWKRHNTVERPWLYGVIGRMVQTRIREHCYPKLVIFTQGGNPSGRYGLGYGYNSSLGAIWLLMAQLLDSQNVTYCRLPDCGRVIEFMPGKPVPTDAPKGARKGYKTRKDTKFCPSKKRSCRQNYRYRKTAGWRGYT